MPWRHGPGTAATGGFVPVELAQTGPRTFTLRADLVHEARAHPSRPDLGGALVVVPAGFTTDLASVPYPLWALIGPFGRHTRAAIVHDHGVRALIPARRSPRDLLVREAVDLRFRDALLDSDVPRLRAYLLWAGTSMDRIVKHAPVAVAVGLVVELLAGLVLIVAGLRLGGWWGLAAVALPLLPTLAWGRARLAVALVQYVGALVLPVILLNAAVSALLAAASLLVGGRAQGIEPTRLPGPASPAPGAPPSSARTPSGAGTPSTPPAAGPGEARPTTTGEPLDRDWRPSADRPARCTTKARSRSSSPLPRYSARGALRQGPYGAAESRTGPGARPREGP